MEKEKKNSECVVIGKRDTGSNSTVEVNVNCSADSDSAMKPSTVCYELMNMAHVRAMAMETFGAFAKTVALRNI